MSQLSNRKGDVIQIIPGQGYIEKERPIYSVLTNFSPFKEDLENGDGVWIKNTNILLDR